MLSEEKIVEIKNKHFVMDRYGENFNFIDFARAIEAAVLPEGLVAVSVATLQKRRDDSYSCKLLCDDLLAAAVEAECEKVPEGYVLVPKSPNWFFMFLKEWDHFKGMGNSWAAKFYEQLIAAAPKPAQASPLDLMECLQDRPVEPSKAVQGKCVVQAENARLREELASAQDDVQVAQGQFRWAGKQLAAAQAKIDSLMLEYCPDEMTPEQMAEWAKYQRPLSPDEQAVIDAITKEQS